METTTTRAPAYRVALYKNGSPRKFVDGTFATREEAERVAQRQDTYRFTPRVIAPDALREVTLTMKAHSIENFLSTRAFLLAPDFDDARARLAKMGDTADRWAADNHYTSVRKGFLKSETGMALMFEVFSARQEWRRLVDGYYTEQEEASLRLVPQRDRWAADDPRALAREELHSQAKAAYEQAIRSLVAASFWKGEW